MRRIGALILSTALLLTGCAAQPGATPTPSPIESDTPTPTPTPTPAALVYPADGPSDGYVERRGGDPVPFEELTLSVDGIGDLPIGGVLPTSTPEEDVVVFDETACQAEFDDGYSESPSLWVANYREWSEPDAYGNPGFWFAPFSVLVEDGRLAVVQVGYADPALKTDAGIGMGSTPDEVDAAYPAAERGDDGFVNTWVVRGERGSLHIATADEGDGAGEHVVSMILFDDPDRDPTYLYATDGTYASACQYA